MTKHEYHIALVLIALISAGILGFHVLNGGSINDGPNCTLSTYISGGYDCGGQANATISKKEFMTRIEDSFTEKNIPGFEFTERRPALTEASFENSETILPDNSDSLSLAIEDPLERAAHLPGYINQKSTGFLTSESHRTFIRRLFN